MILKSQSKSLGYDDVNLLAQPNNIQSRRDIQLNNKDFILVSPMSSIIGDKFIKAVYELPDELQPIICIPRDINSVKYIKFAEKLKIPYFVSVGLNNTDLEELALFNEFSCGILLDVANGYLSNVIEKTKELKYKIDNRDKLLISGSVHTERGANKLFASGSDLVRVGIGGGSVCQTADVTGFTRKPITEISECSQSGNIIADGGIRKVGDINKALFAGAKYVMLGGMFTSCIESQLHQDNTHVYYGMASERGKTIMEKDNSYIEGIEKFIPQPIKNLYKLMREINDGVKSGISYSGHQSLSTAIGNGIFEIK